MVSWFSKLVVATTVRMPKWFVRWVSRRYVAGDSLEDAVAVMKRLSGEGACFTVDVLGEEISSMDEAAFFLEEYIRVMRAIKEHGFDANISIKPTAFGLLIDPEKGMENIRKMVSMAAEENMFVRLDMEDHRVTQSTIDVVTRCTTRDWSTWARFFKAVCSARSRTSTISKPHSVLPPTIEFARAFISSQRRFPSRPIGTSWTPPTPPSTRCSPPVLTLGSQATIRR